MTKEKTINGRPQLAITDSNALAVLGLRQILQNMMPVMDVATFGSLEELTECAVDSFSHYFVSMNIMLEYRQLSLDRQKKTTVLAVSINPSTQLSGFHSLCVNVPENQLVRSLLMLEQNVHGGGQRFPPSPKTLKTKILSDREIEVLSLIAQGYINKEIADQLNIGMTMVVTCRKNVMDKLGVKSISALTIYAVTHGYVDVNKI